MGNFLIVNVIFWSFLSGSPALAKDQVPIEGHEVVPEEKPLTIPEAPLPAPKPVSSFSPINRLVKPWKILGNYSYIDTWVPGKMGLTAGYFPESRGSIEVSYMRGELALPFLVEDLGRILDERLTVVYRSFSGRKSFNLFYGINFNSMKVQLGNKYIAALTDNQIPEVDLLSFANLGLTFGLGNRWQHKSGFVIGVDWFQINLPVVNLKSEIPYLDAEASETRKQEIRDVIDVWERVPTFAVLKFQMGISF